MKRIPLIHIIVAALFGVLSIQTASAQFEGTVGAGLHAGYGAEINSLGVGAHIHYYHTNEVRLAPSFTHFIKRENTGSWMVDADAHYILPVSVSASLYPIAGLHFSHWAFQSGDEGVNVPSEQTAWRLGANMGLGVQHDIGYRVRANYELKYQFIRDYAQIVFMAGIGFWF